MSTFYWRECRNRHPLTTPGSVYINPQGHRRCRACKRESDHRKRGHRTPKIMPVKTEPHKYRRWAEHAWANMTPSDRVLVRHALADLELP